MKLVEPERVLTGLEEKIFTLIVLKLQDYYCWKKYVRGNKTNVKPVTIIQKEKPVPYGIKK